MGVCFTTPHFTSMYPSCGWECCFDIQLLDFWCAECLQVALPGPLSTVLHPFSRKLACKNHINKPLAHRRSRGLQENEAGSLFTPSPSPPVRNGTVHACTQSHSSRHQPSPFNPPRLLSFLLCLQIQAVLIVAYLSNYPNTLLLVLWQWPRKTC